MALARVLLHTGDAKARSQASTLLARAQELTQATGGFAFAPLIRLELAELARHAGDEDQRQRELQEAYSLFVEIGAHRHAERLTTELALPAN
jgi:hypothetical protein